VILPTYNERENLPSLAAAIRTLPFSMGIIVVDDGSPDGTGRLADELASDDSRVKVIHRAAKLGLGTAYGAGFRLALSIGADPILTMDADFSHDPRYLPALLEASSQFDLVIGSRYVKGGSTLNWGPGRRTLSWGANAVAHLMLGLNARDCTAGFRCYRRRVLETVDLEAIRAEGYSYLIEMLFHCQSMGFSVGEVPIVFADRRRGHSKISQAEILKAGLTVLRLAGVRVKGACRSGQTTAALESAAHEASSTAEGE
jgi:dolichol-phosphate mannosyltransferase